MCLYLNGRAKKKQLPELEYYSTFTLIIFWLSADFSPKRMWRKLLEVVQFQVKSSLQDASFEWPFPVINQPFPQTLWHHSLAPFSTLSHWEYVTKTIAFLLTIPHTYIHTSTHPHWISMWWCSGTCMSDTTSCKKILAAECLLGERSMYSLGPQ